MSNFSRYAARMSSMIEPTSLPGDKSLLSPPVVVFESLVFGIVVYVALTKQLRRSFGTLIAGCWIQIAQFCCAQTMSFLTSAEEKASSFDNFPEESARNPGGRTCRAALARVRGRPSLAEDPKDWKQSLMRLTDNALDSKVNGYSVTGISAKEIRDLGNWPDHVALAGLPEVQEYKTFNLATALARPYRPFRWNYVQMMNPYKFDNDFFLEVDKHYAKTIKQRQSLYAEYGKDLLDCLPGAELACKELMEACLQFYCARYPQYFSIERETMLFHNSILGTTSDLKKEQPLIVLLNNIPEDFAINLRDPKTGFHMFRAGVICSALGWNLGEKLGKSIDEIHQPVPDYEKQMQKSMERFFSKWPTSEPKQRASWGLEIDKPLYVPPGSALEELRKTQDPDLTLDRIHLRVDWQTFRRLPLSGAVIFNFKALFTPVTEFADEPKVPSIVLKNLREGKKNLMDYKGTWHVEHVLIPKLEEWERQQIRDGLTPKDWVVNTLEPQHFFEGWEEKWHRQQGF